MARISGSWTMLARWARGRREVDTPEREVGEDSSVRSDLRPTNSRGGLDKRWKRGEAGGESDSVAAGCTEVGVQKAAHRCSRASSRRHERDLERFHGTRL